MSSKLKLREVEFFIELLQVLEVRGESLTSENDPAIEASFLYAAILNAFYSVVEVMKTEGIDTKDFRESHPWIYAYGSKDGERAKTVHLCHIEASKQISETFENIPRVIDYRSLSPLASIKHPLGGAIGKAFSPQHFFYVALMDKNIYALDQCKSHLIELKKYHAEKTANIK